MAFTESSIPNLTGRIAVVTGANGGLGLATAEALAGAGAHVVMAVRDQVKAAAAHDELRTAHSDASLEVVQLDLASQASVKAAAATILASHPKIDILINNAGIMATPEQRTADGYEMQIGVNHLGHWDTHRRAYARHPGRRRGPDRQRHQHPSPWGPSGRSVQPEHGGGVRGLARVPPVETRQPSLHLGTPARVRARWRASPESRRPPWRHQLRSPKQHGSGWCRPRRQVHTQRGLWPQPNTSDEGQVVIARGSRSRSTGGAGRRDETGVAPAV